MKYTSAITIHELFKLTLEKEGKEVAELRTQLVLKEFKVLPVESKIAKLSAEIRSRYRIPMADSMIAATSKFHGLTCVTDDPHISQLKQFKTRWI